MKNIALSVLFVIFFIGSCKSCDKKESVDIGVGPIHDLKLDAINPELAAQGKLIFEAKCSACHKIDEKYVGPALKGVTKRRSPEWIMNMMLNPIEMTEKDPVAKELLASHLIQMTFQDLSQDDARKILEYFRQIDSK